MTTANAAMIETYSGSLQRCLDRPGFLQRFYELFLASSEEVRRKFEKTDFASQRRALQKSLLEASWIHQPGAESIAELKKMAKVHSRTERDIKPEMYDLWLESLIVAAKEADPQFTPGVEAAWRGTLGKVIDFMKARY